MSIKNYSAGGAIEKYRIVKFSADGTVVQATAATDALIGVSGIPNPAVSGNRVDVVRAGAAMAELGGTVTRGDFLTADSNGKAITAAPAAGVNARTIGVADVSGVSGDIIWIVVNAGSVQG